MGRQRWLCGARTPSSAQPPQLPARATSAPSPRPPLPRPSCGRYYPAVHHCVHYYYFWVANETDTLQVGGSCEATRALWAAAAARVGARGAWRDSPPTPAEPAAEPARPNPASRQHQRRPSLPPCALPCRTNQIVRDLRRHHGNDLVAQHLAANGQARGRIVCCFMGRHGLRRRGAGAARLLR